MSGASEVLPAASEMLKADPQAQAKIRDPQMPISRMIAITLEAYGDRPAIGWRPIAGGKLAADFTTMSYAELWRQTRQLAAAFAHDPAFRLVPGDRICTMAFAGPDYVVIELALSYMGLVDAPLQTTASIEQLSTMATELESPCICASMENLDAAVAMAIACPQTRAILAFDHLADDAGHAATLASARERLASAGRPVEVMPFAEARARGARLPEAAPFTPAEGEDPVATIYYTSGSTGTPKGAMYTQRLMKPAWMMASEASQVILHYQPLNHSFGKSFIFTALAGGGATYFTARSDLSALLEDLATIRPTMMALVPRVCELIYQRFQAECGSPGSPEEEDSAMRRFHRDRLGGRLTMGVGGSAPLSPELRAFIEKLLGTELLEGYGTTETGAISMNGRIMRPPVIDYKLIDVPELGYFTTDTPHPRGELIVRTHNLFAGYFGRPDLTSAVIDEDGYYHTGDIMAEIAPDQIVYLDRRNNVQKLAQGEFVAVARLEALFAGGDPTILQIYLYGNSSRSYLLGVIVPNASALPAGLSEAETKARLMEALRGIAAANDLHSYEVPRDVIVEHEPFSIENGLLAGIGKYLRPAFKARYGERLERLYADLATHQDEEVNALRALGREAPPLETVYRAAKSVLGIEAPDPATPVAFADLGGDSLSALSFSMLLEDIYGIPVDVGEIMSPAGDLHTLARNIEWALAGGGQHGVDFTGVHGSDATVLKASDLTLDRFLAADLLDSVAGLSTPADAKPRTVLLTGANGFLGRFLCLEWLERLERTGGTLICIGRGRDDAAARQRLLDVFATDPELAARVARLAENRLRVIAGDLAAPRLGLDDATWNELAAEVDLIVHPAALVNHKLPYRQLFGPNVAGTATLIGLALTTRMKRFVNVSTIAAAAHGGTVIDEDAVIRDAIPEWRTGDGYADGYAASKWAAEVLLCDAHARFGLPVANFRSNMILADSRFSGQLNVPDMFTRWLLSLALTRIAPESFYAGDAARAHYEGLPVDFIAAAIVAVGEAHRLDTQGYHVLNPHDDGISMDSFVAWMEADGVPLKRVAPYAEWFERFEAALRGLPEDQRDASLLPLLHAFSQPAPAMAGSPMSAVRFREGVRAAAMPDHGDIPHLSPALIAKYLADLRALSLLPT